MAREAGGKKLLRKKLGLENLARRFELNQKIASTVKLNGGAGTNVQMGQEEEVKKY